MKEAIFAIIFIIALNAIQGLCMYLFDMNRVDSGIALIIGILVVIYIELIKKESE